MIINSEILISTSVKQYTKYKHIQNSLNSLFHVITLGTMAPSPLIKMNLYLVGKDIEYIPTKKEIQETFTTVLEEIVHIMSTVPRLYEKFALPSGGLKKFYEAIETDQDCNKLQALINDG